MSKPSIPVVVGFPLRGEWSRCGRPRTRSSHGIERFGQRYAFDFVRSDQRKASTSNRPASLVPSCWAGALATTTAGSARPRRQPGSKLHLVSDDGGAALTAVVTRLGRHR